MFRKRQRVRRVCKTIGLELERLADWVYPHPKSYTIAVTRGKETITYVDCKELYRTTGATHIPPSREPKVPPPGLLTDNELGHVVFGDGTL